MASDKKFICDVKQHPLVFDMFKEYNTDMQMKRESMEFMLKQLKNAKAEYEKAQKEHWEKVTSYLNSQKLLEGYNEKEHMLTYSEKYNQIFQEEAPESSGIGNIIAAMMLGPNGPIGPFSV